MIKKNIFNFIAGSFLCATVFALHPAEQETKQREEKLTEEEQAIRLRKSLRKLPTELFEKITEYLPEEKTYALDAILTGHTGAVYSIAWAHGRLYSNYLASGSADGTIRIWDVNTKKSIAILKGHVGQVHSVDWSPNDKYLASGSSDNTIRIWDVETKESIAILRGHTNSVYSVAWNKDSTHLASGSADRTAKIWDVAKKTVVAYTREESSVYSVTWNPSDNHLTLASNRIKIWDFTAHWSLTTETFSPRSITWNYNGTHLISGSTDGIIKLWNGGIIDAGIFPAPEAERHTASVLSLAVSNYNRHLASSSEDGTIRIWSDTKLITTLRGHRDKIGSVYSVAWNFTGKLLASGSSDKTIRIWAYDSARNTVQEAGGRDEFNRIKQLFLKHIHAGDTIETNAELAKLVTEYPHIYELTIEKVMEKRLQQISPSEKAKDPIFTSLKKRLESHKNEPIARRILYEIDQEKLKKQIQQLLRSGATESANKELKEFANQNRALFEQMQQEERDRKIIIDSQHCAICQGEFNQGERVVITKCNHPFHRGCMENFLKHLPTSSHKTTQDCPLCREPIRELGAYNFTTGVRDIKPDTEKLRELIVDAVGAEKPIKLLKLEQEAIRFTLLKLLNTEKRTAEQERALTTLKEEFPNLYQQAYEDYEHEASLEMLKALEE